MRYFGQPLLYPWLILKQAFVEVSFPAANLVSLMQAIPLEVEHPGSNEAKLEGEGTAVLEGDPEWGVWVQGQSSLKGSGSFPVSGKGWESQPCV